MLNRPLRNIHDLVKHQLVSPEMDIELEKVINKFSLSITPHLVKLMHENDGSQAIASQYVPSVKELEEHDEELSDPLGEAEHSPVDGIIHRYKDRVLLNLVKSCAVYCRFCFRREQVGQKQAGLKMEQVDEAIAYIRSKRDIWEVILSGGDPLILSAGKLSTVVKQISEIQHVGIMRVHTRVPVVSPQRITDEIIHALKSHPAMFIVIHVNHADEINIDAENTMARLVDAGIPLLAQTVLLKGINDSAKTLAQLFKKLLRNRVKPYYLHHGDLARGTSHFRTSVKKGQQIMQELRGPVSGLCQPHYVLDIPGGHGKVPVGPQYISTQSPGNYEILDTGGVKHLYRECLK